MPKKKLQIGTICRSIRCEREINNGLLLIIVDIDHSIRSTRGEAAPYLVKRLNGLPFPSTSSRFDGCNSWYASTEVWAAGYKLQPIDLDGDDVRDQKVVRTAPRTKVRKPVTSTV
jgi:hypothetical protein